jgi:DNA invertase Pin-like site-specific DNA recombinase
MIRCALYARYSSDNQRDASIEDQLRLCREHAEKQGWHVAESYADHATSGANLLRPGVQQLLADALAGKFAIILAESLDRLSRDQEDTAAIFKRLGFAGVKIVTLSEGEISELRVGLKGTMNALYLKDLAEKTRRGLRGRIEAGKSGGGNAYGYEVVHALGADGQLVRGDRKIDSEQATVICRIFKNYAEGLSPRAIALSLNHEGVTGPTGKAWGPSTINGNRQRGTGILNNEMYIGRLIWNRLRYVKDPETGKRISRPNPEDAWIIQDVPELRIVEQELWDKVKARQAKLDASSSPKIPNRNWGDRRRPKYLFSGLMKCGECGGGAVIWNQIRIGCGNARNKGTCSNKHTIRRDHLEAAVLDGLQHHLMDPELTEVFCREYTEHMNRLRSAHVASEAGMHAELAKIERETNRIVQAICDGVPGSKVKDRMAELEARKIEIEAKLANADTPPPLMHPNMAGYYREQVSKLRDALDHPDNRTEAADILRTLIDRIELKPVTIDGKRTLAIDLHGHLAGILSLANKGKGGIGEDVAEKCTAMVAGERCQRYLLGLFGAMA